MGQRGCLQDAAVYIFKAVVTTLNNREMKTPNHYHLMAYATEQVPEPKTIFPQEGDFEKKIFHFLKPNVIEYSGLADYLPNDEEFSALTKRMNQLFDLAEIHCLEKISILDNGP